MNSLSVCEEHLFQFEKMRSEHNIYLPFAAGVS